MYMYHLPMYMYHLPMYMYHLPTYMYHLPMYVFVCDQILIGSIKYMKNSSILKTPHVSTLTPPPPSPNEESPSQATPIISIYYACELNTA